MIVMMMGAAGSIISKKYPKVMKGPRGAGFCKDGYFARTAGSKVIAEVVSQDTRPHREQEKAPERLSCFKIPRLAA